MPEPERDPDVVILARALQTVETAEPVPKEHAAVLAAKRLDADGAELLHAAAREYRGEEQVDWDDKSKRVAALEQSLIALIHQSSATP